MNGFTVCLLFPQEMASNKIPESPTKKRKLDISQESMQSGSEELDVLLSSCFQRRHLTVYKYFRKR